MAVVLGLSGCGPAKTESPVAKKIIPADAVRVASKIDTEGALLGNMIVLLLESKGIPTVNKVQLGATKIVRYALTSGEIDIYPEYTGSGAFIFNDEKNLAWKNPKEAYDLVKKLDYDKNKVVWLQAAPANNTWAIAVRSDLADTHHLKTLEDLKQYLDSGGPFKMAASSEFIERGDALPLFEKAYGFKLKQNQFCHWRVATRRCLSKQRLNKLQVSTLRLPMVQMVRLLRWVWLCWMIRRQPSRCLSPLQSFVRRF
jgi:osmoprotectant transport system substrate-binding protein